jgi:Trypsin-co-occurring domain 1
MQDESRAISTQNPAQPVRVQVTDDAFIIVEALPLQGETNVSSALQQFKQVANAIEGVTETLAHVWSKTRPRRASAEFNLAFACDSTRGLLAMFVSGSAQATMKIKLEWGEPEQPNTLS